jgi:hypothetical protein
MYTRHGFAIRQDYLVLQRFEVRGYVWRCNHGVRKLQSLSCKASILPTGAHVEREAFGFRCVSAQRKSIGT